MAEGYSFNDLLLEILGAGNSPLDRRGPLFGVPPADAALANRRESLIGPIGPAEPAKPGFGAKRPPQQVIPGYEREFGVINQQTGGLTPHQGLFDK